MGWRIFSSILSLTLLLGVGMVFPAMAESFPIRLVADSVAPDGKVFISVDFDHDGLCDKPGILISVSTIDKIGIDQQCVLVNI